MKIKKLTFDELSRDLEVIDQSSLGQIKGGCGSAVDILADIAQNGIDKYAGMKFNFADGGSSHYTSVSLTSSGWNNINSMISSVGLGVGGYTTGFAAYGGQGSYYNPIQLDPVVISAQGQSHGVGDVMSDLWNSPMARSIVPDKLTLSISASVTSGVGVNETLSFDFITRGHDASMIPYVTATTGGQVGMDISGDILLGVNSGYYATSDMRSLEPGDAAKGLLGWSANVSADGGAGLGGSITGSIGFSGNPFVSRPTWITGGVAVGGSVGGGVTGGLSYTYPVFESQF